MDEEIDVNDYAMRLINDKSFCKSEYQKYMQNDSSFQNVVGIINDSVLKNLIRKAKRKKQFDRCCLIYYYMQTKKV